VERHTERLARAVQALLGCSFSHAKDEVIHGHVTVDDEVVIDPGAWVHAGDRIEHHPELPRRSPLPRAAPIELLFHDADIVVVNKPTRLVVHPTAEGERDTVLSRTYVALARTTPLVGRLFVVHRLDRDTSGVMVLARTHAAAEHLQRQFRVHSTERRYLALVAGDLNRECFVERSIGRPRPGARRGALPPGRGGKPAETTVRPVERLGTATLVEAELGTGRTHQVRVHLSYLGHPVLGDQLYGAADLKPEVPRLALHATHLGITHPTSGKRLEFTAPLPTDLAGVLRRLRERSRRAGHPLPPVEPPKPPPRPRTATATERLPLRSPLQLAAAPRPVHPERPPRRRPEKPRAKR